MFKLMTAPEARTITPETAQALLKLNTFPGQRNIRPTKVQNYATMLRNGTFRPPEISFAITKRGDTFLVNGQHCLTAIAQAGATITASVTKYACETEQDVWTLFSTFDAHSLRTQSQCIEAARGLLKCEDLHDFPVKDLSGVATALYALQAGGGTKPDFFARPAIRTDKIMMLDIHPTDALHCMRYKNHKAIARVGVYAAIIATLRSAKYDDRAFRFWDSVADGANLPLEDSRLTLHKWLLTNSSSGKNIHAASSQRTQYVTCILYWNSWMTGHVRKHVQHGALIDMPEPVWLPEAVTA